MEVLVKLRGYNALLVESRCSAGFSTQRAFALELGVSESWYGNVERMKVYPSSAFQQLICNGLAKHSIAVEPGDMFPEALRSVAGTGIREERIAEIPEHLLLSYSELRHLRIEGPDAALLRQEKLELLDTALAQLDTRERRIVLLRMKGETYEGISMVVGRTRERVRQILIQGLKKMQVFYKEAGYDLPEKLNLSHLHRKEQEEE